MNLQTMEGGGGAGEIALSLSPFDKKVFEIIQNHLKFSVIKKSYYTQSLLETQNCLCQYGSVFYLLI